MLFYKINPLQINWESEDSLCFFNEKHGQKALFVSYIPRLPDLKSHIWLATSGRNHQKWVALSKKALLISAHAVNQHFDITSKDRWGLCLPLFHVGGLSILARAHLSQSVCFRYNEKWSAKSFMTFLNENKITMSALVPAQVYDLVKMGFSCPPSVRAVVVGGESLNGTLYQSAGKLNWPLLPSYGLTECGSQVATADRDSLSQDMENEPRMKILSHIKVKTVQREIVIQSESLLSGFVPLSPSLQGEFQDPKREGWYFTGDKGFVQKGFIKIKNSSDEQIKILGEKVHLKYLEDTLMGILLKKTVKGRYILLPVPDEREGFQISLVTDTFNQWMVSGIIREFNEKVSPFEKIRQVYFIPSFPLTDILKISKRALLKKLAFSTSS